MIGMIMTIRHLLVGGAALAALTVAACQPAGTTDTADQKAAAQQETIAQRAQDEVGIYTPTRFTRKRLANRIGQMLDDPNLATISYAQGIDGKLRCIGHTIGFPLPASTQTTAPETYKWLHRGAAYAGDTPNGWTFERVPQSEPDQLFYPASADATWVLLVNKRGDAAPAYFEGHVQTFLLDHKPDASLIAQDCTE